MRCSGAFLVLAISLFTLTQGASAQWFRQEGISGGKITAFATIEPKIFAGSDNGGVFSSSDNGRSWNECNVGLPDLHINALTSSGSTLYAALNTGVFSSNDQGNSWQPTGLISPRDTVTALLAMNNTVIAGIRDSGIYTSSDNGVHWQRTLKSTLNEIFEFSYDGTVISASTFSDVFTSANDGLTWQTLTSIPKPRYITSIAGDNGVIIACSFLRGGYRSSDGGNTWKQFYLQGFSSNDYARIVMKGQFAYVATNVYGTYYSLDKGLTWSLTYFGGISSALFLHDSTVFLGTENGIYRLKLGDSIWEAVAVIPQFQQITKMVSSGSAMFAATNNQGLLRSTNEGKSWSSSFYRPMIYSVRDIAVQGALVYAATDSVGLLRSSDQGNSWQRVDLGGNTGLLTGVLLDNANIYVGATNGLFRSTDRGAHWELINSTFTNAKTFAALGGYIFAGTDHGYFRSQDSGATWTKFTTTLFPEAEYHSVVTINNDLFVANSGKGIFLTSDYGDTWNQATNALSVYAVPNAFAWDAKNLYMGTDNFGFYSSSDYGKNWQLHNEGIGNDISMKALVLHGSMLYAALYPNGFWMRPVAELGVPKETIGVQNHAIVYPNPTTGLISFSSSVKHISIASSLGQTIIDREIGENEHQLDISILPSGIYLAKLLMGNSISCIKIIKQ